MMDWGISLAAAVGEADVMAKLTRESTYYNNYRWVAGNPFLSKVKDKEGE